VYIDGRLLYTYVIALYRLRSEKKTLDLHLTNVIYNSAKEVMISIAFVGSFVLVALYQNECTYRHTFTHVCTAYEQDNSQSCGQF